MASPLRISVEWDVNKLRRQYTAQSVAVDKAVRRSVNRAVTTTRAVAARDLATTTGLKVGEVKGLMFVRKQSDFTYALVGRMRPTNLIRFAARQLARGVSAAPWKKRRVFAGAFIGNKGRTVFHRIKTGEQIASRKSKTGGATKHTQQIEPLFGPWIPREMNRTPFQEKLRNTFANAFAKNIARDLPFFLSRARG